MPDSAPLVLASGSQTRKAMLTNAGAHFKVEPARIDEVALQAELDAGGLSPGDLAVALSKAKAEDVSRRHPGADVIGSDQVLALGSRLFSKAPTLEAARAALHELAGRTHHLYSGAVLVQDGKTLWTALDAAAMTMRELDGRSIELYLSHAGPGVLSSVGCYQIEGRGVILFDKVKGDHFTILGMPLLPLLAELRRRGLITP